MRSLHFNLFSPSFLITLLSQRIATSINMQVTFLISRIMMFGLLLGIVLSVATCWFHNMVPYLHDLFRLILVLGHGQCSYSNFTTISLNYYYYYYHHHHHHHPHSAWLSFLILNTFLLSRNGSIYIYQ